MMDILISALLFAVLVELAYRYGTGRWIWNKRPSEGEPSLNRGPDHSALAVGKVTMAVVNLEPRPPLSNASPRNPQHRAARLSANFFASIESNLAPPGRH